MKWSNLGFLSMLAMGLVVVAPASVRSEDDEPAWLFVVRGNVTAVSDTSLTLSDEPWVVAFTDHPFRSVRMVDLQSFVSEAWGEGGTFRADPPNASLIDEKNDTIAVIEVRDMSLQSGALVLRYDLLEGDRPDVMDRIALTVDPSNPSRPNGGLSGRFGR